MALKDITASYPHPAKREMEKMAHLPAVSTYDELRHKCAILFQQGGYGSRMVWPRHGHTIQLLREHFGGARSVIDLGTDGNGQFVRALSRGAIMPDKSAVTPIDIVHATDWLLQMHEPAMRDIMQPRSVPVFDEEGFVLNKAGIRVNEVRGDGDRELAVRMTDTQIFPYSYQELDRLPTSGYDVVLSLHVLNCLFTWEDVHICVDEMKRIARLGILLSTSSGGDGRDLAKIAGFDRLQRIGINRAEWDEFFRKMGFTRALDKNGRENDEHYTWFKVDREHQDIMTSDKSIVHRRPKKKKRSTTKKSKKKKRAAVKKTAKKRMIMRKKGDSDAGRGGKKRGKKPRGIEQRDAARIARTDKDAWREQLVDSRSPQDVPRRVGPLDLLDGE